ncbi:hypothetical protein DYU11_11505 [Fibrisoma montanum]|uniref:Uncharacterized protein n=1 Tax=Fibrisoma montanum TaxID=2305895 RepID=A0A418MB79_9BACT|nr:hypothetical protein DYU11_11505 [Fibrisoma montanum]
MLADSYVNILTQPGNLLAPWARLLYWLGDRYVSPVVDNPDKLQRRVSRVETILKPLLTCVYCVAGQMGFWVSLYVYYWYFTHVNLILSLLTAGCAVWFGGLFSSVRAKLFPL